MLICDSDSDTAISCELMIHHAVIKEIFSSPGKESLVVQHGGFAAACLCVLSHYEGRRLIVDLDTDSPGFTLTTNPK